MAEVPSCQPPEAHLHSISPIDIGQTPSTDRQELTLEEKRKAFYGGDDVYQNMMEFFAHQGEEEGADYKTGNLVLDWWEKVFGEASVEAIARQAAAKAAAIREEGRQELMNWGINPNWTPKSGAQLVRDNQQKAIDALISKGVDPAWILPQKQPENVEV